MSNPGSQRGLTADEIAVLVRFVRDPGYRARMTGLLQQTYFNPDFWRRGSELVAATYLDPEKWRRLGEALQATYLNPDFWRRVQEVVSSNLLEGHERKRAVDLSTKRLSEEEYRSLGDAVLELNELNGDDELRSGAAEFRSNFSTVDDAPTMPDEGHAPLWVWLAMREGRLQAALLVSALAVLQNVAEVASGGELPEGAKNATEVLLGVALCLLALLEVQAHNSDK